MADSPRVPRPAALLALAYRCEAASDSLLTVGNDYSDLLFAVASTLRALATHAAPAPSLAADLHAAANSLLQVEAGKMPREDVPYAAIAQTCRDAATALATHAATPAERPTEARLSCEDCGAIYEDFPLDTTLPDAQWLAIHPERDGGGVLCASCIVKRAAKLPRAIALRAYIDIGGATPPAPDREALVKRLGELEEACLAEVVASEFDTQARAWAERAECVATVLALLRAPATEGHHYCCDVAVARCTCADERAREAACQHEMVSTTGGSTCTRCGYVAPTTEGT